MKYFVYTYHEHKPPTNGSGQKRTVKVYRIVRGRPPQLVAASTDTFMSEFQQVMSALEGAKVLHPDAFRRNENSGGHLYYTADMLKDAGWAEVYRID